MDAFLRRNAAMMTEEEFAKYYELTCSDPLLLLYTQILKKNFAEVVENAVEQKIEVELAEKIKEDVENKVGQKLGEVRDKAGQLEEDLLEAARNLSYEELPTRITELFQTFDEFLEGL